MKKTEKEHKKVCLLNNYQKIKYKKNHTVWCDFFYVLQSVYFFLQRICIGGALKLF